jgi:hypothetical protein
MTVKPSSPRRTLLHAVRYKNVTVFFFFVLQTDEGEGVDVLELLSGAEIALLVTTLWFNELFFTITS